MVELVNLECNTYYCVLVSFSSFVYCFYVLQLMCTAPQSTHHAPQMPPQCFGPVLLIDHGGSGLTLIYSAACERRHVPPQTLTELLYSNVPNDRAIAAIVFAARASPPTVCFA